MAEDDPRPPLVRRPMDSQYLAPMRPEPSWERLQAPSSRVTVKNTGEQTHIVIDRFYVGHELKPGQKHEMEMLNEEIAVFQEARRPDRYYPSNDPAQPGRPKPLHPIVIEGVPSLIDEVRATREAKMAELHREKQEQRERDARGRFKTG